MILCQRSDTSVGDVLTLFCGELDDRGYGTKYLFLHDLHIRLALRENGWLNKVALVPMAFSTNMNNCALLFTRLDVPHDPLIESE
jgi:hypothetical protein